MVALKSGPLLMHCLLSAYWIKFHQRLPHALSLTLEPGSTTTSATC